MEDMRIAWQRYRQADCWNLRELRIIALGGVAAFPHQGVVFDSHPITNLRAGLNKDMITDITVRPNTSAWHDMGKRPHPRPRTDGLTFTQGSRVDKNGRISFHASIARWSSRTTRSCC